MKVFLYIAGLFLLMSIYGCFEVSEADLFEDYQPSVVIEAKITNQNTPYYVRVSNTAPPNGDVDFIPVSGAQVVLSDDSGNVEYLDQVEKGVYSSNEITGNPGTTYNLFVRVGINEFKATEKMENPAIFYKTEIIYLNKYVPENGQYIKLYIKKLRNETSYYKLEVSKNDSLFNSYNDLIIFEDAYIKDTIQYLVPYAFHINDTVHIDLNVISAEMYRYYYDLSKQTTNTFSNIQPPMLNPPSNIGSDALGYFQVSPITRLDFVIK